MHHRSSNSRLSRSPRAALIGVMAFLAILATSNASGAEEGEPPRGLSMEGHLEWCGEGKTAAVRIKRYEYFWALQKPQEPDGYDDTRHIRAVRHCAYRLAKLYAQAERAKDCVKMLKWLEETDVDFEVERGG